MQAQEDNLSGNLTAMIDVVFQLIIFFVATTNMQSQAIEDKVRLALAPHGKPITQKDPTEVSLSVRRDGTISFTGGGYALTRPTITAIITKIVADSHGTPPVVIRADGEVRHEFVKNAMDACSDAGVWRIRFAALKELGG